MEIRLFLDLLAAEFFVSSCEIKDTADNGIPETII
jgi:hypothetical protein